jgi:uncharacterized small protein (DUF1192 family)
MASDNTVPRDVKKDLNGQRKNRSVACLEKTISELQDEVAKKEEQLKEMKTGRDDFNN